MTVMVHHQSLILAVHNVIEAACPATLFAIFSLILFIVVLDDQFINKLIFLLILILILIHLNLMLVVVGVLLVLLVVGAVLAGGGLPVGLKEGGAVGGVGQWLELEVVRWLVVEERWENVQGLDGSRGRKNEGGRFSLEVVATSNFEA